MNPVILDTDPGIDDAVAIVVLLKENLSKTLFLLTTYGNISLEDTTANALTMLSLLNADLPVIKGSSRSANENYSPAAYIHGADGLGGLQLKKTAQKAIEGDYLEIVYEAITACEKVDYITIGPLTNLAALIKRYPDVKEHIETVVTMGGGINMGNVTEFAEFNIHCDAESADFVFKNIKRLALLPLNVTTQAAFNEQQIDAIRLIGTELSEAMAKILTVNYQNCVKYGEPGSTMHDSTAILYYLHPELFETEQCGITVDCGEHYGETIKTDGKNISLITGAPTEILLSKIVESIKPKIKK